MPESVCFGCGPANPRGLGLRCFPDGNGLVAIWTGDERLAGWPGILNGGIIATLFDCLMIWTAVCVSNHDATDDARLHSLPLTAELEVQFRRPTPSDATLRLRSNVVGQDARRIDINAVLSVDDVTCATSHATMSLPRRRITR